jgi:hypothetical protein
MTVLRRHSLASLVLVTNRFDELKGPSADKVTESGSTIELQITNEMSPSADLSRRPVEFDAGYL